MVSLQQQAHQYCALPLNHQLHAPSFFTTYQFHMKKPRYHDKKKKQTFNSFTVAEKDTLLHYLFAQLPHKSKKTIKAVLRDSQVFINGNAITQFDHVLNPGQHVEVHWEKRTQSQQPHGLTIIHEDEDLIIINKPSGLLTVATDKEKRKTAYSILSNYVKEQHADNKIFIIHRLDRETSGLLMFGKNESVKHEIQKTWNTTVSQRTYVGVVEGQLKKATGTITSWLKESKAFIVYSSQNPKHGDKAVTSYKVFKDNGTFSLLHLNLETGRKHQIRVHMQEINHPIIGDKKYGSTLNPIRRMGLHAQVLEFTHPRTGKSCRFETAIPAAFQRLFSTAGK